jgi:hypothetical protein
VLTVYRLLREFWPSKTYDPAGLACDPGNGAGCAPERASEVFPNSLSQLLASGEVMLATDTKIQSNPAWHYIGRYRDANYASSARRPSDRQPRSTAKFTASAITVSYERMVA